MQDFNVREVFEYTMALGKNITKKAHIEWIRVGFALKNTSERHLITWIAFSAKMESFSYDSILI